MPLSIQIPYRGDQYLFQGISGAGQSIGQGIEQMMQRLKQTKAMRTMAVDGLGLDPDAVDQMSAAEVQGHLQGAALKNQQAEAQSRRMMEQAHANYFNRFNQKSDREDAFSQSVNQYMNNAPTAMPNGDSGPMPAPTLDPQTLLRLEAQAGTLDPDKALQYMKQMQEGPGNRFKQKSDREDAFSQSVNQYMNTAPTAMPNGDSGPMPAPTLDPQTLLRLEAQAGTLDPDKALQYMKQMQEGPGADNPLIYDKTSVPHATIIKTKKGNEFQVLRDNDGTAPDAPPGYQMVGDGKGGWKPVKINTGELNATDRAKLQATYEKNIDGLIQSYSFAKGDPEMETLIKGRISAHQKAIADLQTPGAAAATNPPAAAPQRKAMGGYKIGTKYAGLTYQGGDPLDKDSWK